MSTKPKRHLPELKAAIRRAERTGDDDLAFDLEMALDEAMDALERSRGEALLKAWLAPQKGARQ
jgi:hypothetical protein